MQVSRPFLFEDGPKALKNGKNVHVNFYANSKERLMVIRTFNLYMVNGPKRSQNHVHGTLRLQGFKNERTTVSFILNFYYSNSCIHHSE